MSVLIGGEMMLWSDLDGAHGPVPAGGPALHRLIGVVRGRTLVAGPHAPELIEAIPGEDVTVLVRGLADAEALDARFAGRPGTTVWCGSVEKVATVPAYDTVVALDGLDRLVSAEAADLSWDDTLTALLALLRPGGRLLLGVENLFGLHRLLALPPTPADTDWVIPDEHDPSRPAHHGFLRTRLASAGLTVCGDLATYPSLQTPSVLLGPAMLADTSLAGFVGATLSAAAPAGPDQLAEPARLATGALRAGLATALAPGWILLAVADSGAAGFPGGGVRAPRVGAAPEASHPDVVAARHGTGRDAGRVEGGGRGAGVEAVGWPDGVVGEREIRLPAVDLPRGRTLEEHLIAACQRRDLPAVRGLLSSWQGGPAAAVPAASVVVTPGGGHVPVAQAAGTPVEALRELAAALIRGGYAHLWPAPADVAELTATLAGMTGREVLAGEIPPAGPRGRESLRELTAERDRLARELGEARAKHDWYEAMLVSREAELKRVRQVNAVLTATLPGRAVTSLAGGLRAGKRAVRAVVKRARQ